MFINQVLEKEDRRLRLEGKQREDSVSKGKRKYDFKERIVDCIK